MKRRVRITTFFKENLFCFIVCLIFFITGLLRLNELNLYNPDSVRYLVWAESLSQGKGFIDETVPEPTRYVLHAPLYSVLLAPSQLFVNLSVVSAKVLTLLLAAVALFLFYVWLRKELGEVFAKVGLILITINPITLAYSTEILSELPFVLILMSMFLTLLNLSAETNDKKNFWILIFLLSLAGLLRETGVAVVLSIAFYLLLKKQYKKALISFLVPVLTIILWQVRNQFIVGVPPGGQVSNFALFVQHFTTPDGTSIVIELATRVGKNIQVYSMHLGGIAMIRPVVHQLLIEPSVPTMVIGPALFSIRYILVAVLSTFMVTGIIMDLKSQNGLMRLIFVVLFLVFVSLYPVVDRRFLYPLLPLQIFYLITGSVHLWQFLFSKLKLNTAYMVTPILVLFLTANFFYIFDIVRSNIRYITTPEKVREKEIEKRESAFYILPWSELGEWLEANTPKDVVIATPNKDLVIVAGGRKVLEIDKGVPQTYFERTIRDNAAEYVLAPVDWDNVMSYEFKMKESRRMQFVQQWKEGGLALYCVYPSLLSIKNESSIIDTTYPGDLLRLGRFHLNKGEYKQAQNYFGKALKKFQNNNEVLYNLVLATAFQENEPEANRYYRLLSNSAQALSFLTPGQIQLDLLGRLQSARNSEAKERKSIDVIAIARDYWGLGYPVRAYELAKEALQTDSSYFFGLLWGWYFAVQFNEDVQAKKYLLLLSKIDSSNPLVKTITAIMVKRDSLKLPLKPAIRSELHLAIAKGYESAGLPETAIDEAIASLCAYQKNLSTRMFLAQLFEMKKAYRAAKIIQTRGITCK